MVGILKKIILCGSLFSVVMNVAAAGVITPIRATASSYFDVNTRPKRCIEGSGLTVKYPVEDSTHTSLGGGQNAFHWCSGSAQRGAIDRVWITFDLGTLYDLDAMIVWNYNVDISATTGNPAHNQTGRGVRNFDLSFSTNEAFGNDDDIVLPGLTLAKASGLSSETGQVIDLTEQSITGVRYVRMEIAANHEDPDWVGLSEVRFVGSRCQSVPVLEVAEIVGTPFFPRVQKGQRLKQNVRLHLLSHDKDPMDAVARVQLGTTASYEASLRQVPPGSSMATILLDDISVPTELTIEIVEEKTRQVLTKKKVDWQPQKKWRIFSVSYSHHDHGYGGYPHRLRTEVRHENIIGPIRFCQETDNWDDDSKFRYVIETSEPITSFISYFGEKERKALAHLIREGRIQIGGIHSTVNTEMLSHELMARLFYQSSRHTPDMLNVPAPQTAINNDIIGITWPFTTFAAEAGLPYFFHGHNHCGLCLQPAQNEPVFYWQSPDGQSRILTRSAPYEGRFVDTESQFERFLESLGENYPYDAAMIQNASDFEVITREPSERAKAWNERYAYPRLIISTFDMFFDAVAEQMVPDQIKTFAKDANNQWADQPASQAWGLGQARRLGEELPGLERFAAISQALFGQGFPWTDIFEGYHQLLTFHEHTMARTTSGLVPHDDVMKHYETELEENREMVVIAQKIADRVRNETLGRFAHAIATDTENSVVVFNSTSHSRTDLATVPADKIPSGARIEDAQCGREVPHQRTAEGDIVFLAEDVPALGYRTYRVLSDDSNKTTLVEASETVLENKFYRIEFDPVKGTIRSMVDRELDVELVDQDAPHHLNEYLYERIEVESDINPEGVWYSVEKADSITLFRGEVADEMRIRASAEGANHIEQIVRLPHGVKRIDFVLNLDKAPSGRTVEDMHNRISMRSTNKNKEAVYVALPFAVPIHQFHHQLPGAVIEPIVDMFEGAATAHYGIRHFANVSGPDYGVTVSAVESALIQYGYPRSEPLSQGPRADESLFESDMVYPSNSRMYLYLMNNMFSTNVALDQQGPMRFTWSIRSHKGDWRQGQADRFGQDTMNPLWVRWVDGRQNGDLPPSMGFLEIDQPNVVCLALKPSEINGRGFILRFHETQGIAENVTVSLPFLETITTAIETSLVEEDSCRTVEILDGNRLRFSIRPFGVKTIRVLNDTANPTGVQAVTASAVSNMEIALSWKVEPEQERMISHYHVYRGTRADFEPTLLNLVQRPTQSNVIDRPKLQYAGWVSNTLKPNTAYYYRVAAVDRWNNRGPLSEPVKAVTLKTAEKNMVPLGVEGLRVVLVSPISSFNFVNLLWRTACESDIAAYEIYRSTSPDFDAQTTERIAVVRHGQPPERGRDGHARTKKHYRNDEYSHMMFADKTVRPGTTYYYRIRSVETAGQAGPFSFTAKIRTKAQNVKEIEWISLFDGKTLDGWKASENKETFRVVDGMIKADGPRSHLFYVGPVKNANFKNFELKADVLTKPNANSGIYLHTEYQETGWPAKGHEVQINNTHSDWRRTGGLYAVDDLRETPAKDNEWFNMHIIVQEKRVVVKIDGHVVLEHIEPDEISQTGYPKMPGRMISHGTIALQGHDPKSVVYFKNILIAPF